MGRNKKLCNKYKKNAGKNGKSNSHKCRTSDFEIWDKHFSLFQIKMQAFNLYLKDIKGDGNCLFRAIADQLEGNEGNHKKYRTFAVSELEEDREFFQHFIPDDIKFDKYLSLISTDGIWGGNIELQALSKVLGVNFVIHMIDRPPMIMSNEHGDPQIDENGNVKYLHLAYHYGEHIGEHYSSVRNKEDKEGPAKTIDFGLLKLLGTKENGDYMLEDSFGNNEYEEENFGGEEKLEEEFKLNEKMEKLEIKGKEKEKDSTIKQKIKNDYPRNKKCYCGSKKAFKNCCLMKIETGKGEEEKEKKDEGCKKNKHLLILV